MNNKLSDTFLSEWFLDLFSSYVYSPLYNEFIDGGTLLARLWKDLYECLTKLCPYYPKIHSVLLPLVEKCKRMVNSLKALHNERFIPSNGNIDMINHFTTLLNSPINNNLIDTLKDMFGERPSRDEMSLFLSSKSRVLKLLVERNSPCNYHIPVIWVNRSKIILSYMVMRSCLRKAIEKLNTGTLDEVQMQLDNYASIILFLTQRSNVEYQPLNLQSVTTPDSIIKNINILKSIVVNLKGLDTQVRLLSKLSVLVNDSRLPPPSSLSVRELLNPSFINNPHADKDLSSYSKTIISFVNQNKIRRSKLTLTSFSHEIAPLTIGCDDVEAFRYSRDSNSLFALCGFFAGSPHFLHYTNTSNWFMAIIPATKARSLDSKPNLENINKDRKSVKRGNRIADANARKSACTIKISEDYSVNDSHSYNVLKDMDTRRLVRSQRQLTPSNWRGRAITNLILKDIRLLGDRGIPIPYDSVLHFVRPAVLGFRFDNVAGDVLANSNGKQGSLANYRDCSHIAQYWDHYTNTLIYAYDGFWQNRLKYSMSNSVLSSLEKDDPLRMISLISLFEVGDENAIWQMLASDAHYEEYREDIMCDIKAMLEICSLEQTTYWSSPVTEYCAPFIEEKGGTSTNPEGSVGYIDYSCCHNGQNVLKAKDSMHMIENLGTEFRNYFISQKDQFPERYDHLNKELRADFIIPNEISISKPKFSQHTLHIAYYILQRNGNLLPKEVQQVIYSLFSAFCANEQSSSNNLTSQQKMHFTLIYTQFLFLSSFSDSFCSSYIRLFNVIRRILAFRGSLESFDLLYKEMISLLHKIENEKVFDSSTINNHLFVHEDLSYFFMGPPKTIDCYELEWTYSSLKRPKATPKPVATLFKKCYTMFSTNIMKGCAKREVAKLYDSAYEHIKEEFKSISHTHLSIRVLSAYNSSMRYCECSTASILTLWDIEATSTLQTFLEGNYFNFYFSLK